MYGVKQIWGDRVPLGEGKLFAFCSFYSCWNLAKSIVCPSLVVKCFIAAMCSLTLLCELYEDRCVAYRMSVFSDGGTAWRL